MADENEKLPIARTGRLRSPVGEFWFEDGVLFIEFDHETLTSDDVKRHIEMVTPLAEQGGIGLPVLLDFGELVYMDREAREFAAAAMDPRWNKRLAAVYHNPVQRVLASFFLGLNRVRMPLKIAGGREEALEWLKLEESAPPAEEAAEIDTDGRMEAIESAIFSVASGDFEVRLPSSESRDDLDSLSRGISMLAEEIGAMFEQRRKAEEELSTHRERLQELVDERTNELQELNEWLQAEIADRKRALEELRRINAELDGFAHTVSHDLKSPLTAVALASEMLIKLMSEPITDESLESMRWSSRQMHDNTMRMGKLVHDMLELAEAGQAPRDVAEVDVSEVVRRVLEERDGEIRSRGVTVDVDATLGSVRASPAHIYQVFSNLLGNAIEHNISDRPAVGVSRLADDEQGGHRFVVRDNGAGLAAEELDDVFLPFFKGETGNTGVGLSIVTRIAGVYSGRIRAYNDNGACFEVTLHDYKP